MGLDPVLVEVRYCEAIRGSLISVHGKLDRGGRTHLESVCELATASSQAVVVDLCGCTSIDAGGLRVLLSSERSAAERSVPFAVVSLPGAPITRLVASVAVHRLAVHPNRFAALAALAAQCTAQTLHARRAPCGVKRRLDKPEGARSGA